MIRTPIILLVVSFAAVANGRQACAEPGSAPARLGQAALMYDKIAGNWKKHTVTRLDPDRSDLKIPALFQYISDSWNRIALYPYMQYMPEKNRLIAIVGCDRPHKQFLTTSDDGGATWTGPRQIRDDVTKGLGTVCYVGSCCSSVIRCDIASVTTTVIPSPTPCRSTIRSMVSS